MINYAKIELHPPKRLGDCVMQGRSEFVAVPRLTVLVSIEADRPRAWFPGPLGQYTAWFSGIDLSRVFERLKVPGNPMEVRFVLVSFGVKFLRSLFERTESQITLKNFRVACKI
jgi:hypothetical protein